MDTGELNVKIDNGIIQKANQDKNGNDIPSTYATKNELNKASLWKVENGVLKPKDLNEITLDDLASETQYVSEIVKAIMGGNFLPIDGTAKKAISDKNGNDIADTYFPKSGGALSGAVINRDVKKSFLRLCGGTNVNDGASLQLNDNEHDGEFYLRALNTTGNIPLHGLPNGNLTWNNNDLASSAIVAKSLGINGYIKYASGLIIQWGQVSVEKYPTGSKVMFNVSYASRWSTVVFAIFTDSLASASLSNSDIAVNATQVDSFILFHNVPWGNIKWLAIGY